MKHVILMLVLAAGLTACASNHSNSSSDEKSVASSEDGDKAKTKMVCKRDESVSSRAKRVCRRVVVTE